MLVGSVTMEELVLYETGQLSELRNVASKKIDAMHHAKDPADLALARHNRFEHLSRRLGILVSTRDQPEPAIERVFHFRAQIELVFLGQLKHAHHPLGLLLKETALLRVKLSVTNE